VTSQDLIRKLIKRTLKFKWVILIGGIAFAALFYKIAKSKPVFYSVRSSIFPLTASDNNGGASKLNELLGGNSGGSGKNLSDEATINIEEVAKSRKTRDAVSAERIPQLGNKLSGLLLIENYNAHRKYFDKEIKLPKTDPEIISTGSLLLDGSYSLKANKNGLLEINFTSTDSSIITPMSYILIAKITEFYKELKIKKAKSDFDFTDQKVDSLQTVLNRYDREQIQLNNTTLFVPKDKMEYSLPKQNLQANKTIVLNQRNGATSNREEALWRLQRVTPIVEILDRPEQPFVETRTSGMLYAIGGMALGCILFLLIFISDILYKYLNKQVHDAIFAEKPIDTNATTTA
jgi:hypothetical protein